MAPVTKKTVSAADANTAIEAAIEHASKIGVAATVAVLDESGVLKAFARMDGAALVTVQSAQDKAYTAAGFGIPSHAWYPMIKDDPALLNGVPSSIDRIVIFGGGIPLRVDGELVGAIGAGGGSHHQDREIAEAGAVVISDLTQEEAS